MEQTTPGDSSTPGPVTETTEQSEHLPGIDELQAVSLTFLNDLDVPEVQAQDIQQQDEYQSDSKTKPTLTTMGGLTLTDAQP